MYVYFNRELDAIAIGCTEDPSRRLIELQEATSARLELLVCHDGTIGDVDRLRFRFVDDNIRGEWFKAGRLIGFVKEIMDGAAFDAAGVLRDPSAALLLAEQETTFDALWSHHHTLLDMRLLVSEANLTGHPSIDEIDRRIAIVRDDLRNNRHFILRFGVN